MPVLTGPVLNCPPSKVCVSPLLEQSAHNGREELRIWSAQLCSVLLRHVGTCQRNVGPVVGWREPAGVCLLLREHPCGRPQALGYTVQAPARALCGQVPAGLGRGSPQCRLQFGEALSIQHKGVGGVFYMCCGGIERYPSRLLACADKASRLSEQR